MRMFTLLAISAISIAAITPVLAQGTMMKDGMKSDEMMKMSDADMKKMKTCQAMSHEMMTKDAGCEQMMKMHPDMMKKDGMMKHDDMKKSGN